MTVRGVELSVTISAGSIGIGSTDSEATTTSREIFTVHMATHNMASVVNIAIETIYTTTTLDISDHLMHLYNLMQLFDLHISMQRVRYSSKCSLRHSQMC